MSLEWNCTNCGATTFRTEYCERCDPERPDEPEVPPWFDWVGPVVQRDWTELKAELAAERAALSEEISDKRHALTLLSEERAAKEEALVKLAQAWTSEEVIEAAETLLSPQGAIGLLDALGNIVHEVRSRKPSPTEGAP